MFKRLGFIIIAVIMTLAIALPAFAAPSDQKEGNTATVSKGTEPSTAAKAPSLDISKIISENSDKVDETEQFLIEITRPDAEKEVVTKKSYVMSGKPLKDNIVMHMARLNTETGYYEPLNNVDGESVIDLTGIFFQEILLKSNENKIKIVAYEKSKEDDLKLEDIQVNYFTVNYLEQTLLQKILNVLGL